LPKYPPPGAPIPQIEGFIHEQLFKLRDSWKKYIQLQLPFVFVDENTEHPAKLSLKFGSIEKC